MLPSHCLSNYIITQYYIHVVGVCVCVCVCVRAMVMQSPAIHGFFALGGWVRGLSQALDRDLVHCKSTFLVIIYWYE